MRGDCLSGIGQEKEGELCIDQGAGQILGSRFALEPWRGLMGLPSDVWVPEQMCKQLLPASYCFAVPSAIERLSHSS